MSFIDSDPFDYIQGPPAEPKPEEASVAAERDQWFNAYNELRDKGDPSWDMFDATVNAALHGHLMAVLGDLESLRLDYFRLQDDKVYAYNVDRALRIIIDRYKSGNPEKLATERGLQ